MLHVCVTYDYELFLGGSDYSEYEVLVQPTDDLMDLYHRLGICVTFFVDVCSVIRYRELGMNDFPNMVDEQLAKMLSYGHDVQLHIHSQWVNATHDSTKWKWSEKEYQLGEMPIDGCVKTRVEIVRQGINYLEKLLQPQYPTYKVRAFRAGGYCLEPQKEILKLLYDCGIKVDSSAVYGSFYLRYPHYYDYRKMLSPVGYFFDPRMGLNAESSMNDFRMYEVPIGSLKPLHRKLLYRKRYKKIHCGEMKGMYVSGNYRKSKIKEEIEILKGYMGGAYILTFDERTWDGMLEILDYSIRNQDIDNDEVYIAIVGHPKLVTHDLLVNTELFLKNLQKKYGNRVEFNTMSDVVENMGLEN